MGVDVFFIAAKFVSLRQKMIFRSGNEQFIETVTKVMNEIKSLRLDDISEWQRWLDPSAILSRKLFDKMVQTCMSKL